MINWKHEAKIAGTGSGAFFFGLLTIGCFFATIGLLLQWNLITLFIFLSVPLGFISMRMAIVCGYTLMRLWGERP